MKRVLLLSVLCLGFSAVAEEVQETEVQVEAALNREPSFFQPKTLEDISALASLEHDLETSLQQDLSH